MIVVHILHKFKDETGAYDVKNTDHYMPELIQFDQQPLFCAKHREHALCLASP